MISETSEISKIENWVGDCHGRQVYKSKGKFYNSSISARSKSIISDWPSLSFSVAMPVPTMHGIWISRATMAAWQRPPSSVIRAAKFFCRYGMKSGGHPCDENVGLFERTDFFQFLRFEGDFHFGFEPSMAEDSFSFQRFVGFCSGGLDSDIVEQARFCIAAENHEILARKRQSNGGIMGPQSFCDELFGGIPKLLDRDRKRARDLIEQRARADDGRDHKFHFLVAEAHPSSKAFK